MGSVFVFARYMLLFLGGVGAIAEDVFAGCESAKQVESEARMRRSRSPPCYVQLQHRLPLALPRMARSEMG